MIVSSICSRTPAVRPCRDVPFLILSVFIISVIGSLPLRADSPEEYLYPKNEHMQKIYASPIFSVFMETIYSADTEERILTSFEALKTFLQSGSFPEQAVVLSLAHAQVIIGKHYIVEDYCCEPEKGKNYLIAGKTLLEKTRFTDRTLTAQAIAVEAELEGTYFLLNRSAYLFSHGLTSSQLIQEALSVDENDVFALLLLANRYIYTPPLLGGGAKPAAKTLEKIPFEPNAYPQFMEFTYYQLMGQVAAAENDPEQAEYWYREALSLYPKNRYITTLLDEIQHALSRSGEYRRFLLLSSARRTFPQENPSGR